MMFYMMQQQHQDQLNQMKEINKQALKMVQQSINQMAEQIMAMYSSVQAAKKENVDPDKEKGQLRQIKKIQCIQKYHQIQFIPEGKPNCLKTTIRWHVILKRVFLARR